jgi:uncharacterized protein YjiS (DUF1127 family)
MSKTSFFAARETAVTDSARAPQAGVFARLFAALTKARQIQAEREVAQYLARQPDRMLVDIGMTTAEIEDLRAKFSR